MKQTITFRIEVDHPTLLKPEGEFRELEKGELFVGGDSYVRQATCAERNSYLVVFPQPSAAVQLAEEVKKYFGNPKRYADDGTIEALADKVLAEDRAK